MYTPITADRQTNTFDHRFTPYWTPPMAQFITGDTGSEVAVAIDSLFANPDVKVNSASEIKCMAAQSNGLRVEPRVCFATVYIQTKIVPNGPEPDDDDEFEQGFTEVEP